VTVTTRRDRTVREDLERAWRHRAFSVFYLPCGLLYAMLNHMDWETTGRIAALAGTYKIETSGTQNHFFKPEEFKI